MLVQIVEIGHTNDQNVVNAMLFPNRIIECSSLTDC